MGSGFIAQKRRGVYSISVVWSARLGLGLVTIFLYANEFLARRPVLKVLCSEEKREGLAGGSQMPVRTQ